VRSIDNGDGRLRFMRRRGAVRKTAKFGRAIRFVRSAFVSVSESAKPAMALPGELCVVYPIAFELTAFRRGRQPPMGAARILPNLSRRIRRLTAVHTRSQLGVGLKLCSATETWAFSNLAGAPRAGGTRRRKRRSDYGTLRLNRRFVKCRSSRCAHHGQGRPAMCMARGGAQACV
jgi:hypothetical protein